MSRSITLAVDVPVDAAHVFQTLSTTEGQRAFWTADCDLTADRARFGFPEAPVDLETTVTTTPEKLVRMQVTSGFAFWPGSTWEWELGPAARAENGTGVLFRHYGFAEDHPEIELGHVAQTWAMIMARLVEHLETGEARPFFPAAAA